MSDTWNVRVARDEHGENSILAFHEAHYGEVKERPHSITGSPVYQQAETFEELSEVLEMYRAALAKPWLASRPA